MVSCDPNKLSAYTRILFAIHVPGCMSNMYAYVCMCALFATGLWNGFSHHYIEVLYQRNMQTTYVTRLPYISYIVNTSYHIHKHTHTQNTTWVNINCYLNIYRVEKKNSTNNCKMLSSGSTLQCGIFLPLRQCVRHFQYRLPLAVWWSATVCIQWK